MSEEYPTQCVVY